MPTPNPADALASHDWEVWLGLSHEARLDLICTRFAVPDWYGPMAWPVLVNCARHDGAQTWGYVKAQHKARGGNPFDLQRAIDADMAEQAALKSDHAEATRFPFGALGGAEWAPPLPERARLPRTPDVCPWLAAYAQHSAYWAPRAAPAYHAAVGLWVLSTVAARRIVCQMGHREIYPTLFIALVSRSGFWTKTEAATLGTRLIKSAGCGHLLAPDRTTPQFLLKLMSGIVPQRYGQMSPDEQTAARNVLGFSAQRGWFYEEWGGMLSQMQRVDSPHAELNKLLIVLEGGAEVFETGTIQRGLERIVSPYLAMLGNATPRDLAPYMAPGHRYWSDGFWPRIACVTPPQGVEPFRTPRSRERHSFPQEVLLGLHAWHANLGSPTVTIEEEREANGKSTGAWVGTVGQLPQHTMTLDTATYDAYETYNDALLELASGDRVPEDLASWYVRAHEKALRVAMLLASINGSQVITLPVWTEAQAIVEEWRVTLHTLLATVHEQQEVSAPARVEQRITALITQAGALTAREIQRHMKGSTSDELGKILKSMVALGALDEVKSGRRNLYTISQEEQE